MKARKPVKARKLPFKLWIAVVAGVIFSVRGRGLSLHEVVRWR